MSAFKAHPAYLNAKRYLRCRFVADSRQYIDSVAMHVYPSPAPFLHTSPAVELVWNAPRPRYGIYADSGGVPCVRARIVLPIGDKHLKHGTAFTELRDRASFSNPIDLQDVDWAAFLSLCRMVGASRAHPALIPGWIEDNMPEPWSLLVSPTPRTAIAALVSPLTLLGE